MSDLRGLVLTIQPHVNVDLRAHTHTHTHTPSSGLRQPSSKEEGAGKPCSDCHTHTHTHTLNHTSTPFNAFHLPFFSLRLSFSVLCAGDSLYPSQPDIDGVCPMLQRKETLEQLTYCSCALNRAVSRCSPCGKQLYQIQCNIKQHHGHVSPLLCKVK